MWMYTAEWNTVSQYCTKIKPCKDLAYNNNNSINWIKVKIRHARYAMSFPTVNAYFSCLSKYATWRNASWRNTNNDRAWQVRQTDETCSGGCIEIPRLCLRSSFLTSYMSVFCRLRVFKMTINIENTQTYMFWKLYVTIKIFQMAFGEFFPFRFKFWYGGCK